MDMVDEVDDDEVGAEDVKWRYLKKGWMREARRDKRRRDDVVERGMGQSKQQVWHN